MCKVCVCSIRKFFLKRGVLKEITPHSLGVHVTHALVVAERFPHLHSEVREAAPWPHLCLHVLAEPS